MNNPETPETEHVTWCAPENTTFDLLQIPDITMTRGGIKFPYAPGEVPTPPPPPSTHVRFQTARRKFCARVRAVRRAVRSAWTDPDGWWES